MVEAVTEDINIVTSDGFVNNAFSLARAEAVEGGVDNVSVTLIAVKSDCCFVLAFTFLSPGCKIVVYFVCEFLTPGKGDNPQRTNRNCVRYTESVCHDTNLQIFIFTYIFYYILKCLQAELTKLRLKFNTHSVDNFVNSYKKRKT